MTTPQDSRTQLRHSTSVKIALAINWALGPALMVFLGALPYGFTEKSPAIWIAAGLILYVPAIWIVTSLFPAALHEIGAAEAPLIKSP